MMKRTRRAGLQNPPTGAAGHLAVALLLSTAASCNPPDRSTFGSWEGRMDTLENGAIRVANPPTGLWGPGEGWRIVEDLRIGAVEGEDPENFGAISLFEVDTRGRIWIFDNHALEIRVFDQGGRFIRVVGGRGNGPGELKMVTGMGWAPNGDLWVVDPGNMRFTVFDTSGAPRKSLRMEGGVLVMPWPGRFDRHGRLNHYARRPREEEDGVEIVMVQYDTSLAPGDTLRIPEPGDAEYFELMAGQSYMNTEVPFAPRQIWRMSPEGEVWSSNTSTYSLVRLGATADSLLIVEKESEEARVTDRDLDSVAEALSWFTDAGGQIEWSRIPRIKPALRDFFFDDRGGLWVLPMGSGQGGSPVVEVFDDAGRYLGQVTVPFPFEPVPGPIVRGEWFYAITLDVLGVPFLTRGRIERGAIRTP